MRSAAGAFLGIVILSGQAFAQTPSQTFSCDSRMVEGAGANSPALGSRLSTIVTVTGGQVSVSGASSFDGPYEISADLSGRMTFRPVDADGAVNHDRRGDLDVPARKLTIMDLKSGDTYGRRTLAGVCRPVVSIFAKPASSTSSPH
ncbi:MAG: hypothetical protein GC155_09530 [Alphaproteobacteria bacterium]|nr:hypothetical protein [Alphaproteobacteria bacterium]